MKLGTLKKDIYIYILYVCMSIWGYCLIILSGVVLLAKGEKSHPVQGPSKGASGGDQGSFGPSIAL